MNKIDNIQIIVTYIIVIIAGCIAPYVSRRNKVFGVHVPIKYYNDKNLKRIRRNYLYNFLISSLIFFAIIYFKLKSMNIAMGGIFIEIILMFIMYLRAHSEVVAWKSEKEWSKEERQEVVVDMDFRKKHVVVSQLWFLIPIIILILSIIIGLYMYPNIQQKIPIHFNSQGIADSYVNKSVFSVFLLNIIELFIIGIMFVSYKSIEMAKQQVDSSDPEASIEKNLRFRRLWSIYIVISSVIISIIFMIVEFISWGIVKEGINKLSDFSIILGIILTIIPIVLAVITGQGGERIRIKNVSKNTNSFDRDDDKYWKLGIFYYNRDDSAIFVEKRFGVGLTVNWGNNIVWIGTIAFILIMAIIIFLPKYLLK